MQKLTGSHSPERQEVAIPLANFYLKSYKVQMLKKTNIYIVRHGQTDWNIQKKMQGRSDIPLNSKGEQQAQQTGIGLKEQGIQFDRVYSSPLCRALKTAGLISGFKEEQIIKEPRIIEFAFGKAEGATIEERRTNPKLFNIRDFFLAPEVYKAAEDAETFEAVSERTKDFWQNEILPLESSPVKNILVVTHGGTLQSLLMHIDGRSLKDFWAVEFKNCSVNLISLENGKFNLEWASRVFYKE